MSDQPRLYDDLAEWWYLLSAIDEYEDEAGTYTRLFRKHSHQPIGMMLELGSGGGNNAWHMKASFGMTLVDVSGQMLAQSRRVNPELEHVAGDMRTIRLGREFDAVFVHDAVDYMTTIEDLRRAMETAFVHCRSGGVVMFVPDHLRETYRPETNLGGHDGPDRALRYLEWSWDPDPADSTTLVDYAFMLRLPDGSVRVEHDRHEHGLFSRREWIASLEATGFMVASVPFEHAGLTQEYELFVGHKP